MKRMVSVLLMSLASIVTTTSFAAPSAHAGESGQGAQAERPSFPMPADAFKKRANERLAKWKSKMEDAIKAKAIPEARAKEMRARFAEASGKINEAVNKAAADGTVTKEEAKEVRRVAKEARPHHGKKHGHGRGKAK
jgi:hypothetical protein